MYEHIPCELKELKRWVCWKALQDESREGKIRKIPVNPHTGGQAQSNNPETWSSYAVALNASNKFNGIGFMFGDGYFGIDIDGAGDEIKDYKSGGTDNIIAEFIHTLKSYSEYSVSKHGIHIICKGALPLNGRRKKNVEMYSHGRFFIMTGDIAAEYTEIIECTQLIKPLHEKYIGGGLAPAAATLNKQLISLSDSQIIELAGKSKQGTMFTGLYLGDWESYFPSRSEADMSFCNMLAFWCKRDYSQIDSIFRTSGLMREKWDRAQSGSTYGNITIGKAISSCKNVYENTRQDKSNYSINFNIKNQRKFYSLDDTGNAERIVDLFGEELKYSYISKKWMYYDGRKWCYDVVGAAKSIIDNVIEQMKQDLELYVNEDDTDMEKAFMKHLKSSRSNKSKTAMLKETEHRISILPDQFDTFKHLTNTPNGIINLRTGELTPHDPKKYLTKISFAEYTDKSDCPLWEEFLKEIFKGDKELIRYIQKAVGYGISGSTQEQCAFFCYGTGRNGKSTFLDTISDILGDYAVNIQPETIMIKPQMGGANSDVARLKGARFVTSVEPNEGMRLNEGLIKQLTGGDKVTARKQYENEFEFMPEFKLWMGTNHKPVIRGTDTGIWRRIHLIPFTVQIPENKTDKMLKHKLKNEAPGIFKWMVDGCLLWQKEGLEMPKAVSDAVKEYRGEMDVISAFIEQCCTVGDGRVSASELFRAYIDWAELNNEYKMSNTKFGREVAKRFEKVKNHGILTYLNISLAEQYRAYQINFGGRVGEGLRRFP